MADDLSVALLLVLKQLSPLERAAFLLHDVFDLTFEDIAGVLGREPAACRKLASRARRRVVGKRPPIGPQSAVDRAFIDRFQQAAQSGDVASRLQTWCIDWNAEGEVQTIYAVRNPDKLERLRTAYS